MLSCRSVAGGIVDAVWLVMLNCGSVVFGSVVVGVWLVMLNGRPSG